MGKLGKKTIILAIILMVMIIAGSVKYYQIQAYSLENLGYTKKEVKDMVNPFSIFHIVTNNKNKLLNQIEDVKKELRELGVNEFDELEDTNLVGRVNNLSSLKEEKIKFLNNEIIRLEKIAKDMKLDYKKEDGSLFEQYSKLTSLVNGKLDGEISKNISFLEQNGYSKNEISKLKNEDNFKTYENLLSAVEKEKKTMQANNGFASETLKNAAMRMFNETNKYRVSKGLKPYKYNYGKQSCVFLEANAYARNGNPHNWLCKGAANENAGLAGVKSDYVGAAMTFFKNDPPHERVLSGNYNSVAIAIVQRNGMMYMIMDVFK